MGETIQSEIKIKIGTSGLDPDRLAHSLDKLAQSESGLVSSTEKVSRIRERDANALERRARLLDKEYALLKRAEETERLLERARASGLEGMEAYSRISASMSKGLNDNSTAAGLAAHSWTNLGRQAQDAITMLAMGSSPMQVLTSQGAQIYDVFSSSKGGAGAALKDFALTVGRGLTNPVTLAAGAMGAAAYAAYEWQKQTDALTISLNGLGRASGLTREGAMAVAEHAASASGISNSSARGLAAQYLGAGISGSALGGAIGLTRDFGHKLGLGEDDAVKTLASALADPSRGAEQLAQKFGLLSHAQVEEIQRTADLSGKSTAATKMVTSLTESLDHLHDPTLRIVKLFERLKDSAANFFDRLPAYVQNPNQNARIGASIGRDIAGMPDAQRALISGRLDEGLAKQLGIDKIASDAALAAKEITAQTFAQREAVTMEKGRIAALQDTKNATQHLMEAEAERLRLMAEAEKKVSDYTQAGQRDRFIAGASNPLERRLRQIDAEGQELLRQIPDTIQRRISTPRHTISGPRSDGGTGDLLSEAQRRGLDPTEENFQKLIDEGVGSGKFRGRLVNMNEGFGQSTIDIPNVNAGRLRSQAKAEIEARKNAEVANTQRDFFDKLNSDLEKQTDLLNAESASFGKSTEAMERARKEQELLNLAKQAGIPLTDQNKRKIEGEADAYGKLAARREEETKRQNKIIGMYDEIRSASRDMASGIVNDFREGASGAKVLENALDRLLSKLIEGGIEGAVSNIFGKSGTASGGILGNLVGQFFGHADGGFVGIHGSPMLAPIGAFAGAPHFASGGMVGSPRPIIAHDGELILNTAQQRNTAAALAAAQQAVQGAQRTPGLQMPKLTINNLAPGVVVRPEITRDEMVLFVESRISTNNKKQSESARRSA